VPRGNPRGRHSLAPRSTRTRRLALVAAPVATVLAIGVGVLTSGFTTSDDTGAASSTATAAARPAARPTTVEASERTLGTSRSVDRVPLVDHRVPRVKARLWTTADLDLRIEPREKSGDVGLVKSGKRVAVTGKRLGEYSEVVVGRATRWVTSDYLSSKKKPEVPKVVGLSDRPCPDGSGIESAIQPAAVKVYRAACAAFPELTTYGGQDGHGEHVNGEAIDFMVPDASVGQRLADYLYAHHAELGLFDIIWSQHIWTIQRAGEGFRSMPDRGSPTANHYDHVHIKIN
jgi:hypothetical protein